jgi:hypothetical protein
MFLGSHESYHVLKFKQHLDTSRGSTRVFLACKTSQPQHHKEDEW